MNPNHPVYVISKSRWQSRLTIRALTDRNIPHFVVIEPQEYSEYSKVIDPKTILQLPFSNLGQGSIPARNWVWQDSISRGATHHWILDDNIRNFYRFHNNMKWLTTDGTSFYVIEDFVSRYTNVALAGMQYAMFIPRKEKKPPFVCNTRIYSCILIKNSVPYRWRGRYNEDTDLSLRVLRAGWCTILSNAFLANKMQTCKMRGGNTDELYKDDGRYQMAVSLQLQHPDVVTIKWKWGRPQHVVDYKPFKKNKLILREGFTPPPEPNEYGMKFIRESVSAETSTKSD